MKFTIIICLLSLLALAKTTIAQRDPPYLYSSDGKMINSYHFTNNGDPFMGFNQTEISYKPRVLYKIVSATVDENVYYFFNNIYLEYFSLIFCIYYY